MRARREADAMAKHSRYGPRRELPGYHLAIETRQLSGLRLDAIGHLADLVAQFSAPNAPEA